MGIFSRLWKGVKKVVKKIGRGIKKVVGKVGKFVGKLGIVGQIGMFFLMPHVAGFLMSGLSTASAGLLNFANATSGLGGALAKGLGTVLKTAHSFAGTVGNVFGTITEGVSNFAKTALNKIPGITIDGAATNFFGNDSAWSRTMDTGSKILDPFKGQTNFGKDTTFADASKEVGIKESTLRELNPQFGGDVIPAGANMSTDFSSQGFKMAEAYKSGLEVAQPSFSMTEDFIKSSTPYEFVGAEEVTADNFGVQTTPTATGGSINLNPDLDFSGVSQRAGKGTFTMPGSSELIGRTETGLALQEDVYGKVYSNAANVDYDFRMSNVAGVPQQTTGSMLSRAGSAVGQSFSADPLGTVSSALDIAQQGKNLVTDVDYPQQRGQVQDFGNAATLQNRQVAGVDTSWMQFGTPAYQSGYSNYDPFAYLQFMQSRTA